jgi:hypothetical protein
MCRKLMYLASFILILPLPVRLMAKDPYRQDKGPDGIITAEAENFDENVSDGDHYWEFNTDIPGFSGAGYMRCLPDGTGSGSPRLNFQVNFIKTGIHYVYVRGYSTSGTDDSCHVGLDDDETLSDAIQAGGGNGPWVWSIDRRDNKGLAQVNVTSAGVHTLHVRMREDGWRFDKIVLTTNPDYTPSGLGPDESHRGAFLKAYDPMPADGALYPDTWATLAWIPGETAASHDVYFGVSLTDVDEGAADTFQGNQSSTVFVVGFPGFAYPEGLIPGTTYYWRVDEVEADGTTKHKGDIWRFTVPSRKAYNPTPADGAKFVKPDDVTLSWTGGLNVKLHHVYFGDDFDVVSNAAGALPQTDATYNPGPLAMDTTYYWRVDEFDGMTTHTGDVWSFTTLSEIPITDPTLVGWWKFEAGSGTAAIDFSGHGNHGDLVPESQGSLQWVPGIFNLALEFLGDNKGYVELPSGMVTTSQGSILMWIKTDLMEDEGMFWYGTEAGGDGFGDQNEIHIHVDDPGVFGFWIEGGDNDVSLGGPELAGAGWTHVAATWDLTDGCRLYANGAEVDSAAHNNTVADLAVIRLGRPADVGDNNRYYLGLMDDVRLFDHAIDAGQVNEIMTKGEDPRRAGGPQPQSGAVVNIDEATPLSWSPGENAAEHDVYFGTDKDDVTNADTSDTTGIYRGRQTAVSYTPEDVVWGGGPYYWRVDEVNTDGTITTGGIWSFSVLDFILVEDFESYTDDDAAGEAIWQHWIDGFGIADNGSQVGYLLPPYAERTIVHGGSQSMPLFYNNTGGITNSEATLTLATLRDWTHYPVDELSLWFHGIPASVGSFVEGPAGTYTMTAGGVDIWDAADEMHYAFKTLSGVGSITAKVVSLQNTDPFAKAGLMIRNSLDPDSVNVALLLTPENGVRFQYRQIAGDITDREFDDTLVAPYWIKLERDVGSGFRGYTSPDGVNWQQMTLRPSATMNANVYIGLALTSHAAGVACEAVFSNVTTTGNISGQWTNQDIGIISNAAEPLYVAISNASGAPAVVANEDPAAATIDDWTQWRIPLQGFVDQGINLSNVDKIAIGLGSQSGMAAPGGSGTVYVDDLRLYRSEAQP